MIAELKAVIQHFLLRRHTYMSVTLKDIAAYCGVSIGTVDRALHNRGRINPEVRDKILAAAKELDYQPNTAAQKLHAKNKNLKIGFVLPIARKGGFWADVVNGINTISNRLKPDGLTVLSKEYSFYSNESVLSCIDSVLSDGVSGIALVPLNTEPVIQKIRELSDRNIPVVLVNSPVDNMESVPHLCYVGSDYFTAGTTAAGLANMFFSSGSVNAAAVGLRRNFLSPMQRLNGFQQELIRLNPSSCVSGVLRMDTESQDIRKTTYEFLLERPEVNCVLSLNGPVHLIAQGISDVTSETKREIHHISYDFNMNTKSCLENGSIDAIIDQESEHQGYRPVRIIYNYLVYGTPPDPIDMRIRTEIILPQNMPPLV